MERPLSRREELTLWRQQTGRTYMKRPSYVQQCAVPVVTPQIRSKITKPHPHTCKSRKRVDVTKGDEDPLGKTKMTRREMLIKWQSEKKVVKGHQNQNILTPINGSTTRRVKGKEETCKEVTKCVFNTTGKIRDRMAMRDLFQQDIDRTVAEMFNEEEEDVSYEMDITRDSDSVHTMSPDHMINIQKKPIHVHRRRSTSCYVDSELAFLSSTIRYSMVASEYRKGRRRSKRRHTCIHTQSDVDSTKRLLYLTPVRRSTRKSRSMCPEVKGELCFDSPSQAEGYDLVKIIPNDALTAV